MANPSRLEKIQITGNSNSGTATKVNVQEANGEVNTQTINTGFNKNFGLNSGDVVGATTLLNQYSTTPSDWTAQSYVLNNVVFYAGKQWIANMATVADDVPSVSSKWEEITFEALSNKTVIVDAIPTDGSNNAVSSNGVFDALATKAPISSVHNPVTLGTANGLSLDTQQLSLGLASSGVTGALSGTDWNTFNNKVGGSGSTNFLTKWSGTNTVNASGAWRETSNRLANAADNGSSDFQVTGQIDLKSKNTQGDGGQLGAELLTTGTGDASWTGTSFATGYTHATGSVTTLTSALAPVINNLYQVAYTVTGRTAGSFTIAFGGATTAGITSSSAVGHRASTTGTLVITPTSDFNGTIVLSIKQITAGTASFVFRDNGGTLRNELRFLGGNNTASGLNALRNNTTGASNTANGVSALQNNTTGGNNTASGVNVLQNNTTGASNTANGVSALLNNTTGASNTASGVSALQNNTTGGNNTASGVNVLQNNTTGASNTANGVSALLNNTTGANNTASGVSALQNNTTGTNNTASGVYAGRFISNGATSLTVANNSTFLGANTKALSDNSTNETVVGYNAIGDGNNTVSIGNTSIVSSRLRGRLLQGNVVDNSIDSGQFSGNVLATGFKTASGTASQFLKANGSVDSNTYLTSASLPTVDQTIIDGSTNAVSGNAVFDGLATKFPTPTGLTTNYLPKWNGSGLGNSGFYEDATGLNINGQSKGITFDNPKIGAFVYSNGITHKIDGVNKWSINVGAGDGSENYNIYSFDTSKRLVSYKTNGNIEFIPDGGRALFNTTIDNGVDRVQVAGTISASPATTANQVVVKSQLDAVAARPYKVYTALLSQTGTNAPTATVLENTLGGTVVWSYVTAGLYNASLTGAFANNKTACYITRQYTGATTTTLGASRGNDNFVGVVAINSAGAGVDSQITNVTCEIRVYN